jgi:ATP-dependent DNA helicase RecQ
LSEEDWVVVQKILSAVGRLDGRFGRARIAEVLKGSKTKGVTESGLDQHRCYGLLETWTLPAIVAAVDELIADGSLEQRGREYPLLGITDRGKEVMFRRVQPRVELQGSVPDAIEAVDPDLVQALKQWRLRQSRKGRLKPYQVFSNQTLEALASHRPTSESELLAVPGIGPAKLDKYGADLLRMMRAAP